VGDGDDGGGEGDAVEGIREDDVAEEPPEPEAPEDDEALKEEIKVIEAFRARERVPDLDDDGEDGGPVCDAFDESVLIVEDCTPLDRPDSRVTRTTEGPMSLSSSVLRLLAYIALSVDTCLLS
jgi:hypothetical protein